MKLIATILFGADLFGADLFGADLFGAIALVRGISLGQDVDPGYVAILALVAVVAGIWLFILRKRDGEL